MTPLEIPKAKKTSAYFSFCKQHREKIKARLKDAGQSISAPALTKALSELWRSLSDEEKQKYKDPSASSRSDPFPPPSSGDGGLDGSNTGQSCSNFSRNEGNPDGNGDKGYEAKSFPVHLNETDIAGATDGEQCITDADGCTDVGVCANDGQESGKNQGDPSVENGGLVFPLARIKRIIKLDKEIRVVAADASNLIANATQLFIEHLAMAAHASALQKKHKTIRIVDVKNAVKSESRVNDFLAEALDDILLHGKEDDSESSDGADDANDATENIHAKEHARKKPKSVKKPLVEPPAGTRKIADFFASNRPPVRSSSDADAA